MVPACFLGGCNDFFFGRQKRKRQTHLPPLKNYSDSLALTIIFTIFSGVSMLQLRNGNELVKLSLRDQGSIMLEALIGTIACVWSWRWWGNAESHSMSPIRIRAIVFQDEK